VLLRPFLNDSGSCASYVFGCMSCGELAVVDAHVDLVDQYLALATSVGAPIVAVFETHIQADHISGLPAVVAQTGATAYLPAGADVEFDHVPLADGARVELGNARVDVVATPGHAPAHNAYVVSDGRRAPNDPWVLFSGDSLLIGDVGRPDLHSPSEAHGQARLLHASLRRLLRLPDQVLVMPSHYGGSVCGRGLSGNPFSSIGFERLHNPMLAHVNAEAFARALLDDIPPRPNKQEEIVAANRSGRVGVPT
jgi:glyoxylase-like metal-dependent hydrolase (beta-lactamase superfamily II)